MASRPGKRFTVLLANSTDYRQLKLLPIRARSREHAEKLAMRQWEKEAGEIPIAVEFVFYGTVREV